jgi:hypothetical protein
MGISDNAGSTLAVYKHHIGSMQELYKNYKVVYRQHMLIHRQYTGSMQEFA